MSFKRLLVFSLSLAVLFVSFSPLGLSALAAKPMVEVSGLITEVMDGGILLEDLEQGTILLNIDTETVFEGNLAETSLSKGMYVFGKYNGILTRSQPAQAHADRLGCYTLTGTVAEALDGTALLTGDPVYGDALVRLGDHMPHVFGGVPITVYYNGTMALSYPPEVDASYVVVPTLTGSVKEVQESSLSLVAGDGQEYTVQVDGLTFLPSAWFDHALVGKRVTVYYDGTLTNGDTLLALEVVAPSSIVEEPATLATEAPATEVPEALATEAPVDEPQGEPTLKPEPTEATQPEDEPTSDPKGSASPSPVPSEGQLEPSEEPEQPKEPEQP